MPKPPVPPLPVEDRAALLLQAIELEINKSARFLRSQAGRCHFKVNDLASTILGAEKDAQAVSVPKIRAD